MNEERIRFDDEGQLEVKPSDRLALLWSFDPTHRFEEPHEMVGSVIAHMGHIDIHGAVYWGLRFIVSERILNQYDCPLSGYLYNSSLGVVQYRTRVIDMSAGPKEKFLDYIPSWRSKDLSQEHVYLLIDQFDEIFPHRPVTDFKYYDKDEKVPAPPSGNYFKVKDPLY